MANSRHLWVGGLPEDMSEDDIRDYFTRCVIICTGDVFTIIIIIGLGRLKELNFYHKDILKWV